MVAVRLLAIGGTIDLFYYVSVSIFIIVLAFLFTKYIGKNFSAKAQGNGIKIKESLKTGGMRILLIEFNDRNYLIAENVNTIQVLDQFNKIEQEPELQNDSFDKIYNKTLEKNSNELTNKLFEVKRKYGNLKNQLDRRQKYDK